MHSAPYFPHMRKEEKCLFVPADLAENNSAKPAKQSSCQQIPHPLLTIVPEHGNFSFPNLPEAYLLPPE